MKITITQHRLLLLRFVLRLLQGPTKRDTLEPNKAPGFVVLTFELRDAEDARKGTRRDSVGEEEFTMRGWDSTTRTLTRTLGDHCADPCFEHAQ